MAELGPALTNFIPIQELPPGAISSIRNEVIKATCALASKEMNCPVSTLVVRDIRPYEDLGAYSTGTTASTVNNWNFIGPTGAGYAVFATGTMADQRYVAIYGAKDLRIARGPATEAATTAGIWSQDVSLIKINVGGGDRAIWDMCKCFAYARTGSGVAGVSSGAVLIPQGTVYTISLYQYEAVATAGKTNVVVLEGIVVEPRGKVLSP